MIDTDEILHPLHYTRGDIESIDAIRAALGEPGFTDYCRGSVIKYLFRAEHKGDLGGDLKKAAFFARMAAGDDPNHMIRVIGFFGPPLFHAVEGDDLLDLIGGRVNQESNVRHSGSVC